MAYSIYKTYSKRLWLSCFAWVVFLSIGETQAQVRLPNVQVPQLPPIRLPVDSAGTLNAATDALDPQQLRDLRRLRIRELLRANPRELEAGPNGAPIVRAEISAFAPNESSLQIARTQGFVVVRETDLQDLGIKIVIFAPPPRMSTRTALRRLRGADPSGIYDFNHIYIESGHVGQQTDAPQTSVATQSSSTDLKVGLIDTGVAVSHPTLNQTHIERFGCEKPTPAAHGTAVASLLVGHANSFDGALPKASLFAADVYCGLATGGSIEKVAAAFSWLAAHKVAVINVSLVGPKNQLLEKVIAAMIARGHLIVAAVGNDGPAAPPLYPAAYPGVIGVTGVDAKRRVLVEALRGPQVHFSAPGSDMGAAGISSDYVAVRGTSFAAPIVAGLLARKISAPDVQGARLVVASLDSDAIDLGARGVDKIYGYGLIGESVRNEPSVLAVSAAKR